MSIIAKVLGQTSYRTFVLKNNQTISHLLYYDLKISPIYGKNGFLEKVLRFNDISKKDSKGLPEGYLIKVPEEFLTDMPSKELSKDEVINSPPKHVDLPQISSSSKKWKLSTGLISTSGKSKDEGQFSAFGPLVGGELIVLNKFRNWETSYEFNVESSCLDCEYFIPSLLTVRGSTLAQKKFNESMQGGVGISLARNFYVVGKGREYKIIYGHIPYIILPISRSFQSFDLSARGGFNLPSKVNKRRLNSSPILMMKIHTPFRNDWELAIDFVYEERNLESFKQNYSELTLGLSKPF